MAADEAGVPHPAALAVDVRTPFGRWSPVTVTVEAVCVWLSSREPYATRPTLVVACLLGSPFAPAQIGAPEWPHLRLARRLPPRRRQTRPYFTRE